MWNMKKRHCPKRKCTLPVAKENQLKRFLRPPQEFKASLQQEYKERLRVRKIRPDFKDQNIMDKELIRLRVNEARHNKSEPFENEELEGILDFLNQGRARDPEGLCSELFHG